VRVEKVGDAFEAVLPIYLRDAKNFCMRIRRAASTNALYQPCLPSPRAPTVPLPVCLHVQ
jgi:hypothetical protein